MRIHSLLLAATAASLLSIGSAQAAQIMPSFAGAPGGWSVDRYPSGVFQDTGAIAGRANVIEIGINHAGDLLNRPAAYQSDFYNTQGMTIPTPGGAGDSLSAGLYVASSWLNSGGGYIRSDLWAFMNDPTASPDPHQYGIIGFTNYGGAARFRVWDADTSGGWVDLGTSILSDAWNDFSISLNGAGTALDYYINNSLVYTDGTISGVTGFDKGALQAYNFNSPSLGLTSNPDYTAYWSNKPITTMPVDDAPTLPVIAAGLVGLLGFAFMRRRREDSGLTNLVSAA
ncbi:MAG TPA: hypothetical protein VJ750_01235 [Rhizomicrobium sp.]|nr:hypothetical protein [Rhizomicrobium sp.]